MWISGAYIWQAKATTWLLDLSSLPFYAFYFILSTLHLRADRASVVCAIITVMVHNTRYACVQRICSGKTLPCIDDICHVPPYNPVRRGTKQFACGTLNSTQVRTLLAFMQTTQFSGPQVFLHGHRCSRWWNGRLSTEGQGSFITSAFFKERQILL